jgi:hypothetical protein
VVVAGLLTAQALGINIKPLLAVGESAAAAAVKATAATAAVICAGQGTATGWPDSSKGY